VRSISWKLGGALLLIVVVSVGLMAYMTNLSTTREFRQYISHGSMMYVQDMEENLRQFYVQGDTWTGVQEMLADLPGASREKVILADNSGLIVGDTTGEWLGNPVSKTGLNNGIPIIASGQEVGKFYVLSFETSTGMGRMGGMGGMGGPGPMLMLDAAEQDFLERTNRSLWIAGLIATSVALLIGLILTRQISRPIRALIGGASRIAKGDLVHRVKVNSKDEIGELAQSFNAMTESLDKSEQARQRLIADITHELRTPLTVVEGTVNGIIDGVFEPDDEHLNSIKEQTSLLTRLISDLRDLSLAESGQLRLELTLTNMDELIRRKVSQNEVIARGKNVKLVLNIAEGLSDIAVDPVRVEQIIGNLLSNAIHYTQPEGIVTVSMEAMSNSKGQELELTGIMISVADTGEGIAAEHLPHIFDRFYRIGDSRSRSEGGIGLGLAIVKQMVEAHGGKVWVESKPGQGSIFYLALPTNFSNLK
jgi:signal transduction histidine kinase